MRTWQEDQLRRDAQRMVRLEQRAKRAEARHEHDRAADIWARREIIQWQRSLLLRDVWDARRGTDQQRGA
jgi:hypothetical protein